MLWIDMCSMVGPALFTVGSLRAVELGKDDVPALQRFFEANTEYFFGIGGQGPAPDEALHELEDDLRGARVVGS
jgi:hypothetical protein